MTAINVKRRLIVGSAASLGLGVGGYMGWQEWVEQPNLQAEDPSAGAAVGDKAGDIWGMQFDLPNGGILKMADFRGKALLLNFWATWCPPCVEELPLLERFYQQNKSKSWQVIGIAVDKVNAVNQFLKTAPLSFPLPLAGLAGIDLSRSLGNLTGGLPFTVIFNPRGDVVVRQMGQLSQDQINKFSELAL